MSYDKKADVTSLDEDLRQLRESKFSPEAIQNIKIWVYKSVLKEIAPPGDLLECLKDGTVLCKLANILYEADTGEANHISWKSSKMSFVQMDQISQFLSFSRKYGVPEDELFQTIDLFEKKDPAIVFQTLKSLSRYANKKHPDRFPVLGPQLSTKKPRPPVKSKPKHLQDGTGWSTFEYGYMKGASQATEGVVLGQRRDIV
ncbi:BCN_G0052220.mRNA.1.CDS.1 [Saccharomyces cerevisiae]|nr:BCN_G0052220.mRNA.1.CDS.1 [Saccharomyces cerevisiae]CAI4818578.1 BCE_3a_G0052300.mRNA.1.CDS.1 [Saccharomyces cerevisiae]CAI7355774.1 BCN_G0052220.mRNA.1.CDS.1 [Saccharomyces cerevisiae]CAI7360041.1 BCE_3a_G0052300.mRNA.1.CDS.1 [Saccharomyces cerevisiae]